MFSKIRQVSAFSVLVALIALTITQDLSAATPNWENDTNGHDCNINRSTNWSGGAVPGVNDQARFGNSPRTLFTFPGYAFWIVPATSWITNQIQFVPSVSGLNSYGTNQYRIDLLAGNISFSNSGGAITGVSNASGLRNLIRVGGLSETTPPLTDNIVKFDFNVANASADIFNSGLMYYEGLGSATIKFTADGATASNAHFTMIDNSNLRFMQGSTASSAVVSLNNSSIMDFQNSSVAAFASVTITDNATLNFSLAAPYSGQQADVVMKNGTAINNIQGGGNLLIGQANSLNSLNSDTYSNISLGSNMLNINGLGLTMVIAGNITGVGGGLGFFNQTDLINRTTAYLLRDSTAANSYTGPTIVYGNNTLVGNTTSLANSVVVDRFLSTDFPPSLLVFDQDFNGTFFGNITGTETDAAAVTIQGGGQVQIPSAIGILPSTSSVAIPVTIKNGTLIGDTGSLLSNITLNDYDSKLIFRQSASGTYSQNLLSGTNGAVGSVLIDSPGVTVTINDANTVTVGSVRVKSGNLTGKGDNLTSPIALDNDTNLNLSAATTAMPSNISGGGALILANKVSSGTVTLTGVNSYTGGTTVGTNVTAKGNTLAVQGNIKFTDTSGQVTFDQSVGAHSPVTGGVYSGSITGLGKVTVQGGQAVTFTSAKNTYSGGTTITGAGTNLIGTTNTLQGNVALASSGKLTFDQTLVGDYLGNITGTGTMEVKGGGWVNLLGTNTFSGPITVSSGTLEGNTTSLQQDITNLGTVQFTQKVAGTYTHALTGTGNLVKMGPGALTFNSAQTAALTTIAGGELILSNNPTLTGSATVLADGIFTANGTVTGNVVVDGTLKGNTNIGQNLTVQKGGFYKPGNSIGTTHVGGNVSMAIDSQYGVQVDGAGNATDTIAVGTISLIGGEVDVTSSDGTFLLNHPYQIMHSNTTNGLSGTFSVVQAHGIFNPLVVDARASYDPQNAYITLNTTFENCLLLNQNELNIAFQFDHLINPPTDIQALLQALVLLPCDEIAFAFDQMSGEQYSTELTVADMTNRQFIRRLYDPLRNIVRTPPCCRNYELDCCNENALFGHDLWLEGGGTRISIDTGHEGYGLKANGYEVVGGLQHTFEDNWTVGLAAGYFQDQINFKLSGKGKMNTVDVGLYTLYRPDSYYVLGDLTFGTSSDKVQRSVNVTNFHATIHSKTRIYQGTFYAETGKDYFMDWPLLDCVLIQPFIGMELGYAHRSKINEKQGGSLDLEIKRKSLFKCFSRLGFHFNTMPELGQMQLSLDLAWNYRLADAGRCNKTHFIAFGETFNINGLQSKK